MFNKAVVAKIEVIADRLGVESAALLAVAEVESAGVDIWRVGGQPLPPYRHEGHYFYKRLKGAKRVKAVAAGLANPKAGAVKNPSSYSARYALYKRAEAIDPQAAFESGSWGLGQVMGAHWAKLGFATWKAMYAMVMRGVDGQIEVMSRYIKEFGLVDELQSHGWKSFADQYNGPASAKNNYAAKIKAAYNRWLTVGSIDQVAGSVMEWQQQLKDLGYYKGATDGVIGAKTKAAVRKFQKEHGIVDDGKMGPMTRSAMDKESNKNLGETADVMVKTGAGTTGIGTAGEVVLEQAKNLDAVPLDTPIVQYIILAITLVGVALILYGLYCRARSSNNNEE